MCYGQSKMRPIFRIEFYRGINLPEKDGKEVAIYLPHILLEFYSHEQ